MCDFEYYNEIDRYLCPECGEECLCYIDDPWAVFGQPAIQTALDEVEDITF